eukprot:402097_1
MMLFETITVILLIINSTFAFTDYSSCNWFGNNTNIPLYPIDVCTSHSHETELDGLWLYSTKLHCNNNDELLQFEYNNTNCQGSAYNTMNYSTDNGYYFNCGAQSSCPFVKAIFWELDNSTNEHICAYNKKFYHQFAIITNICLDMIEEYNTSFYVDCTANSMTFTGYKDAICTQKSQNLKLIEEGCDDPFDVNAYVQISECDDANVNPIITPLPTATIRTTMPTISAMTTATPSKTRTTTMQSKIPTKSPTVSVSPSMSRNDSKSDSSTSNVTWIAIVVSLCVVVMILVVLLIFIVCRQKRLKSEVLLNENMSSINVTS